MHELSLLKQNRRLSDPEFTRARRIASEVAKSVNERANYMASNGVDCRFALPDANWVCDGSNEFDKIFRRIAKADPQDVNCLRAFTQVFSGYNLLGVCNSRGLSVSDLRLDSIRDEELSLRLQARNEPFIHKFLDQIQDLPRDFVMCPPIMLGEIGHLVDGILVNSDTYTYQESIRTIYQLGLGDFIASKIQERGEINVCEIGGGYGALCHWFMRAFPNASYTIIDLPEALLFSRLYVSLTRPDLSTSYGLDKTNFGVRFLPNYMAEKLVGPFDLVINTLSLSEMSEYQVRKYAHLIRTSWLQEDGAFFEQNQDNTHMGLLHAQDILAKEFPCRYAPFPEKSKFCNGFPNVWTSRPFPFGSQSLLATAPSRVEFLEDLGDFNLIRTRHGYWCLHKSLGPTDPLRLDIRDYPPVIYFGVTADEARKKIGKSKLRG